MSVVERNSNSSFWGLVQQKGPWKMTAQDYKHQSSARGIGGTSLGRGGTLHAGHGSYEVTLHPYQQNARKPPPKMSKWAQRRVVTKPLDVNIRKPVPGLKFNPIPSLLKGINQTLKGLGAKNGGGIDQGNAEGGAGGPPASQTPGRTLGEAPRGRDFETEDEMDVETADAQRDILAAQLREHMIAAESIPEEYFDAFEGSRNNSVKSEIVHVPNGVHNPEADPEDEPVGNGMGYAEVEQVFGGPVPGTFGRPISISSGMTWISGHHEVSMADGSIVSGGLENPISISSGMSGISDLNSVSMKSGASGKPITISTRSQYSLASARSDQIQISAGDSGKTPSEILRARRRAIAGSDASDFTYSSGSPVSPRAAFGPKMANLPYNLPPPPQKGKVKIRKSKPPSPIGTKRSDVSDRGTKRRKKK